jgi:hypothetical protein
MQWLYHNKVAADYFKAMDRIEGLTAVPALEGRHVYSPRELFGLLVDLKASPLNPEQQEMVSVSRKIF